MSLRHRLPSLQTKRGPLCTQESATKAVRFGEFIGTKAFFLNVPVRPCVPSQQKPVRAHPSSSSCARLDSRVQMAQFFPCVLDLRISAQLNSFFVGVQIWPAAPHYSVKDPPSSFFKLLHVKHGTWRYTAACWNIWKERRTSRGVHLWWLPEVHFPQKKSTDFIFWHSKSGTIVAKCCHLTPSMLWSTVHNSFTLFSKEKEETV